MYSVEKLINNRWKLFKEFQNSAEAIKTAKDLEKTEKTIIRVSTRFKVVYISENI
jgi:hypothetical protein